MKYKWIKLKVFSDTCYAIRHYLLKTVYLKFVNDNEPKIQKTIAHSFGEIAKILDPKISENEIGPIITNMYHEENDEIRSIISWLIFKKLGLL